MLPKVAKPAVLAVATLFTIACDDPVAVQRDSIDALATHDALFGNRRSVVDGPAEGPLAGTQWISIPAGERNTLSSGAFLVQSAYQVMTTEVTGAIWTAPGLTGNRTGTGSGAMPRAGISWNDLTGGAVDAEGMPTGGWLKALNDAELAAGRVGFAYRLPTAEEWEAAGRGTAAYRAGDGRDWCRTSEALGDVRNGYDVTAATVAGFAWFDPHAGNVAHAVARKHSCGGLFDTFGNVHEWTATAGSQFGYLAMGGSYATSASYATVTGRVDLDPTLRSAHTGVRLVRFPRTASSSTTWPAGVQMSADVRRAASAEISPAGGVLTASAADGTTFTLTVPPGALATTETITLTPIVSVSGLPAGGSVKAAVEAGPSGLRFRLPVSLAVELPPSALLRGPLAAFGSSDLGSRFHLTAGSVSGNVVTTSLIHFSETGVGEGLHATCGTADASAYAPDEWAQHRIGCLIGRGLADDGDLDDQEAAAIAAVFEEWFHGSVAPGLADAKACLASGACSSPQQTILEAMNEFLDWIAKRDLLAFLDLSGLEGLEDVGRELAAGLFSSAIQATERACATRQDPAERISDAEFLLQLQLWMDLIGWAEFDSLIAVHPTIACGYLHVSPASATIGVGATVALTATVTDVVGNPLTGQPLAWHTDHDAVAIVDANGVVTGVAEGHAIITVVSEGKIATASIIVEPITAAPVVLDVSQVPTSQEVWSQSDWLTARLYEWDVTGNLVPASSNDYVVQFEIVAASLPAAFGGSGAPPEPILTAAQCPGAFGDAAARLSVKEPAGGSVSIRVAAYQRNPSSYFCEPTGPALAQATVVITVVNRSRPYVLVNTLDGSGLITVNLNGFSIGVASTDPYAYLPAVFESHPSYFSLEGAEHWLTFSNASCGAPWETYTITLRNGWVFAGGGLVRTVTSSWSGPCAVDFTVLY